MPYTSEHKSRTRLRIVESARALFNQRGFLDVSIDEVMAYAGLTRGGFYNHFKTKEDLLLASVDSYAQCNPTDRWDGVTLDYDAEPEEVARQMLAAYLSDQHLEDVAGHCPLVALPADAARASKDVKRAYRGLLGNMINVFERGAQQDKEKAFALTAMCVGAMLLGRTVDDEAFAHRMLAATREQGAKLIAA